MKRFVFCCLMAILITAAGCSFVSTPVISDASKSESSTTSVINEASSVGSDLNLPTNEFSLSAQQTFEVNVMTTEDWQSFEDDGSFEARSFSLMFPENWVRDAEGASTFHNEDNDIKVFEAITAVKLPADFDFAGSFKKENFEDPDTVVIGDILIGKLTGSDGEKTYAKVVQSVIPGGGGIQIDRWYPYFYVIVDGDYAYCMQFYSLEDPAADDTNADLFREIMGTFKVIS